MLELRGVSKSFGGVPVLPPIDLAFAPGQTTVLLGPSGCGKSTILRLLVGLIWPDTGSVRLDGEPLTPENAIAWRRRLGYMVQDGGLFPHLTVRGNVTLLARHLGRAPKWCETRLAELAALTRLPAAMLDRYPAQLSGGQRQRVSLMRALILDPAVILLDEPLTALDPLIRADLQADLREIFRSLGKTVVFVTHDLAEAGLLGDTVVLLRDGRVVQQGALAELVRAPADEFVTRFVNAQRPISLSDSVGEPGA